MDSYTKILVEQIKANNPLITNLNITQDMMYDKGITKISEAIKNNTTIKNISFWDVIGRTTKVIRKIIKNRQFVLVLINQCTDKEFKVINKYCVKIKDLRLIKSQCSYSGYKYISPNIDNINIYTDTALSNNIIGKLLTHQHLYSLSMCTDIPPDNRNVFPELYNYEISVQSDYSSPLLQAHSIRNKINRECKELSLFNLL